MDESQNKLVNKQLRTFLQKLRREMPASNIRLLVQELSKVKEGDHHLLLQVQEPDIQFELHAKGQNLNSVLVELRESLMSEMSQRKAMMLMMAEGIQQNSPIYNTYLH